MPNDFLESLKAELPPIIARSEVHRLTGGVLNGRSLANLDSLGQGPDGKIYIGKRAAYTREALLDFLAARMRPAPERPSCSADPSSK